MTTTMINKNYILTILSFFILSCSDTPADERPISVNCGKVVRLWSQNTSFAEGNPCGNNNRGYTIQVTNDITGNAKNFCVNISEYIRYDLGNTYCDRTNLDGW